MNRNIVAKAVTMPLADRVHSQAWVVRSGADLQCPIVLIRTPYEPYDVIGSQDAFRLVERGWAVVVQSVRGRHGSGGDFTPFVDEARDGAMAVEWCREQTWCDGCVFLLGKSYEGLAAWAAAAAVPTRIDGIVVTMTAASALSWFWDGGAFRNSFAQSWGLSLQYTNPNASEDSRAALREHARDLGALYELRPPQSPLVQLTSFYSDWLRASVDAYWDQCGRDAAIAALHVPAYILTGWNDIFCAGAIADYVSRKHPLDRLIVGPWSHDTLGQRVVGRLDFGVYATTGEFDEHADMQAWRRSVLAGTPTAFPVHIFVMGLNRWVATDKWPLRKRIDSFTTTFEHVREPSRCQNSPTVFLEHVSHVHSPGGRVHQPTLPLAGGHNGWGVRDHPSSVIFECERLTDDLVIFGDVDLTLAVTTPRDEYDICVWLFSVPENGEWTSVCFSIQRVTGAAELNKIIRINFGPVAFYAANGTRLAIAITSSCFPDYDVLPFSDHKVAIVSGGHGAPKMTCSALLPDDVQTLMVTQESHAFEMSDQ